MNAPEAADGLDDSIRLILIGGLEGELLGEKCACTHLLCSPSGWKFLVAH